MALGHAINFGLTIPPGAPHWLSAGHCAGECTQATLPREGIKVYMVFLHGHYLGKEFSSIVNANFCVYTAISNDHLKYIINYGIYVKLYTISTKFLISIMDVLQTVTQTSQISLQLNSFVIYSQLGQLNCGIFDKAKNCR